MATLKGIAEHFGLAESTISRALNGKGHVSERTRQEIVRYAREVNYHANGWAKNLRRQRSDTVGFFVPDITNDFYAQTFSFADELLQSRGRTAILFNGNENTEREDRMLKHIRNSTLDGMIVATTGSSSYGTLPDHQLANIVFIDNQPKLPKPVSFIGTDNERSSTLLTEHLIERGHRQIAAITGPLIESSAKERSRGFKSTLRRYGIQLPKRWNLETTFLYDDGYASAHKLLSQPDRPTAVIAQNNVLGYATVRVCQELGLRIPEDVAVACFDHVDVYGFMKPVITSVTQSPAAIATAAVDSLLTRIAGAGEGAKRTIIDAELHIGETT